MTLLVLGSTGLLGQALVATARGRGVATVGLARSNADLAVDVRDTDALAAAVDAAAPDAVVNCAALVDLGACERDPGVAYAVNARPAGLLAEATAARGARLVQISTDHYWTGDGSRRHAEDAAVRVLNEYARTKLAGEALALTAPAALVVRTNIVGARGWAGRPTFAEWAFEMLESGAEMTLFDDFFTSSIDTASCATAVLDLLERETSGVVNVAASEVSSKRQFVDALASAMGLSAPDAASGAVAGMAPPRAESLGLDVSLAESLLGRSLPDRAEVARALVTERRGLTAKGGGAA
jgi:dTDP-4-dehydrorhamnose reductase